MAERDRSSMDKSGGSSGSRSGMDEGMRNTAIKRETDVRNSLGPSAEDSGSDRDRMDRARGERMRDSNEPK